MTGSSLEYIRNYYNVPAVIGRIVTDKVHNRTGFIIGTMGPYLTCCMYDNGQKCTYYPPELEYGGMITGVKEDSFK